MILRNNHTAATAFKEEVNYGKQKNGIKRNDNVGHRCHSFHGGPSGCGLLLLYTMTLCASFSMVTLAATNCNVLVDWLVLCVCCKFLSHAAHCAVSAGSLLITLQVFFLFFPLQSARVWCWAFHYVETLTLEFLNRVTPSYGAVFTAWILNRLGNIAVGTKEENK